MMEASMFSRRTVVRASFLALAAALIPACGTKDEKPPLALTQITPTPGSNNPRQLNIVARFDRALDPATAVLANFVLVDSNSAMVTLSNLVYNATLFEVSMQPQSALGVDLTGGGTAKAYQMNILTGVKDTQGLSFAGAAWQFTVPASDDDTRPAFNGLVSAAAASPTSINLTWDILVLNDTDGHPIVYDIYMSTVLNGVDLQQAPRVAGVVGPIGLGFTYTITTLAPLTPYYFIVRARDSTTGDTDTNVVERTATPM
jgi:hypothetical protein